MFGAGGEAALGDDSTELLGLVRGRSPLDKQLLMRTNQQLYRAKWENKPPPPQKKNKIQIRGENHPKCSISPYRPLWVYSMQFVDFIPPKDGRANSQWSPLHSSPSLIVNSVNEVNLINFRTGSHMTFSSIFSATSKTSISSWKMGRSE